MTTFHSVTELIGNTPLLQLHKLNSGVSELFLKLENQNPGGSIKDRVALSMINEGIMEPNGIFRILVAVPPIGIFLSTIIAKKKYSEEERDNAKAVGIMGCKFSS